MKKRILSIALILCMVLAVLPTVEVFATVTTYTSDDGPVYTYDDTTSTLTIGGTGTVTQADISSALGGKTLIYLEIGGGIAEIGVEAFALMTSLKSITILGDVTIGERAFGGCSVLESVYFFGEEYDIPDPGWVFDDFKNGLTLYGYTSSGLEGLNGAFSPLNGTCGATASDNVTWKLSSDGTLTIGGTGAMEDYKDYSTGYNADEPVTDQPWKNICDRIISIVVEEGVTRIGNAAFLIYDDSTLQYCCQNLTSMIIHGNINIGTCAFLSCTSLTSVTIEGNADFDYGAFDDCRNMKYMIIYGKADITKNEIFVYCYALERIYLFDDISFISNNVYPKVYGYTDKVVEMREWVLLNRFKSLDDDCSTEQDGSVMWHLSKDGTLTIGGEGEMTAVADWATFVQDGVLERVLIDGGVIYTDLGITPKYTVTFKSVDEVFATHLFLYDGDTLVKPAAPTRACHRFDGWYLDEEYNNPVDFTKPVTEDITVYAKWIFTGHDFTAEIKSDNTLVSAATCQDEDVYYYTCSRCGVIEYDDAHTFEDELAPDNHAKALGNWQMDESKHWKAYICCPTVTESEGTHNYVGGKCECGAVNYTVTFDANGGDVDTASATTDIYGKLSSLPTPTRSADYRFDGWYTAKEGGKKISGSTVFEANTTVYARWTDIVEPTGEITLGTNSWKAFLNNITFGLFFKDTQEVTITATDNSGEDVTIEYLLSDKELSSDELAKATFTAYSGKFNIAPNNEYIIYAKLTDKAGNVTYINSNGIALDNIAPVISGIEDSKTYCAAQTVTVTEKYVDTVTVNGKPVTPDTNGEFTLSAADVEQKIVVTDKAGNQTEMTVTVNDGHTGGTANCMHKAKCEICGEEYGEVNTDNHTTLKHTEAKAATVEAEGNIEYWHCEECNRYFGDKDGETEIKLADTVIAKLTVTEEKTTDTPKTGDNRHIVLWLALLLVSGGGLFATIAYKRRKRCSVK